MIHVVTILTRNVAIFLFYTFLPFICRSCALEILSKNKSPAYRSMLSGGTYILNENTVLVHKHFHLGNISANPESDLLETLSTVSYRQ